MVIIMMTNYDDCDDDHDHHDNANHGVDDKGDANLKIWWSS